MRRFWPTSRTAVAVVRIVYRTLAAGLFLAGAGWGLNAIHASEAHMHEHIGEERAQRRNLQVILRYQRELASLQKANRRLTRQLRRTGRVGEYATR